MKPFLLLFLLVGCLACSTSDDDDLVLPSESDCSAAIGTVASYDSTTTDSYTVVSASVADRCLTVTVAATGCNAADWTARLVTEGVVLESLPTQTSARLLLDLDQEAGEFICTAITERTFTFDLSDYVTDQVTPTNFSLYEAETTVLIP